MFLYGSRSRNYGSGAGIVPGFFLAPARCTSYDEVVEKSLLSNTFFTLRVALSRQRTYRTARRVFIDLLASAEPYFLTESV